MQEEYGDLGRYTIWAKMEEFMISICKFQGRKYSKKAALTFLKNTFQVLAGRKKEGHSQTLVHISPIFQHELISNKASSQTSICRSELNISKFTKLRWTEDRNPKKKNSSTKSFEEKTKRLKQKNAIWVISVKKFSIKHRTISDVHESPLK